LLGKMGVFLGFFGEGSRCLTFIVGLINLIEDSSWDLSNYFARSHQSLLNSRIYPMRPRLGDQQLLKVSRTQLQISEYFGGKSVGFSSTSCGLFFNIVAIATESMVMNTDPGDWFIFFANIYGTATQFPCFQTWIL